MAGCPNGKPEGVPGDCADGTGPRSTRVERAAHAARPTRTAGLGELRQNRSVVQPTRPAPGIPRRDGTPIPSHDCGGRTAPYRAQCGHGIGDGCVDAAGTAGMVRGDQCRARWAVTRPGGGPARRWRR
jgi:hypothetical protein